MKFKLILISLAAVFVFSGVSCAPGSVSAPGGFHISLDAGQTWAASNNIVLGDGSTQSLARYDITDLEVNEREPDIIYASTRQAGLYKSTDKGVSWTALTTRGQIQSVAINNVDTNHLAAARGNQLFFSRDKGKIWSLVYTDPSGQNLSDVVFDPKVAGRMYISLISGELIISRDSGETWSLLNKFNKPIKEIITHAQKSGLVFIMTTRPEILKSIDAGRTWTSISENIDKNVSLSLGVDFDVHPRDMNHLLFATQNQIILSRDGGKNWQFANILVNSSQGQLIRSIAWDTSATNVFYMATPTVFYRTNDYGSSYSTSIFSSNKSPSQLLVDPKDPQRLYIGTHS